MTETQEVLKAFACGRPMTYAEIEEISGVPNTVAGVYVKRLRDYGDIERVVYGCKCVKHQITAQGRFRLDHPREKGGEPKSKGLLLEMPRVNSVFSLGALG